jgi:3'-5' exoribonuclease
MSKNQRLFISDSVPGQAIDQVYLVRQKELRTTRSGEYYISATLGDRTGSVPARMWQANESVFEGIPTDGFLHVRGRMEDYRGTLQLVIDACRPWPGDKVDLGDFLSVSQYDIEEMWSDIVDILGTIRNRHLKHLIKKFLEDKQLVAAVKKAPAAVQMHHPFVGGLLEHTRNVLRACQSLLPMYPQLNGDLVLAGGFLHDIGKSAELTGGLSIHYTDRGQLVGHLVIASIWVQEKARQLADELGEPFPPKLINLLQHLILAHHGEHEFGSPKLPAIPEAFFLHFLDNLDAKMYMTAHAIESDSNADSSFTGWVNALQTRLYKHARAADDDDGEQGPLFDDNE